ncbi:MAG: hypothetical protein ACLGHN_04945 [Bacteriovoracia bacterium]
MKIQWSVFLSFLLLFTLVGCGGEEFGTAPQSTKQTPNALTNYSHSSCSTFTLIRPKVDVLYVVDNSSSNYYIPDQVKSALGQTVNSLSSSFDFRVIGTPLLETSQGNADFQVMTNSSDLSGIPSDARRITSASYFSFFSNAPTSGAEKGLGRLVSFLNAHQNALIRRESHLVVVLVSNGRDAEVEDDPFGTGQTVLNTTNWNARLTSLRNIKTSLDSLQLRLISVTAHTHACKPGWRGSEKSYIKMSKQLYADSGATDNPAKQDAHDLCNSETNIFEPINNSIQQVLIPHQYRYWPITFAENDEMVSLNEIRVHKVSSNGTSVELTRNTDWTYEYKNPAENMNTRELPTPGEPVFGSHFIRFSNLLVYPDCVLVTSVSRTEYFGFVVLPQKPVVSSINLRINGRTIPQSSTNGWSDLTSSATTRNIKVPYPAAGDENPPVIRTGFMLQLNGASNYYKSGDNVEVNYIPAGI